MKVYTSYCSNDNEHECASCKYFVSQRNVNRSNRKGEICFSVEDKAVCSHEFSRNSKKEYTYSCWLWQLSPDIEKLKLEIQNEEREKELKEHKLLIEKNEKEVEKQKNKLNELNESLESTGSKELNKTTSIGIVTIAIAVAFMIILFTNIFGQKVEGKYKLVDVYGNVQLTINYNDNYLTLDDGVCTIYLSIIKPQGSSVHKFYYTGKKKEDVKFNESHIFMNSDGKIIVKLDYGNGLYNTFTYEKD